MEKIILKGHISHVSYEEDYDDDGYPCKKYSFSINGKKVECPVPKSASFSDGDLLVVLVKQEVDKAIVTAGIQPHKNYKWGKNPSSLKGYVFTSDTYEFARGFVQQKRKGTSNDLSRDSGPTTAFTIYLENRNFYAPLRIGEKIKKDDELLGVFKNGNYTLLYNKTQQTYYGKKLPAYLLHLVIVLASSAYLYHLFAKGSIDKYAFYGGAGTIAVIFLLMALFNFSDYRYYLDAKKILDKQLKDGK